MPENQSAEQTRVRVNTSDKNTLLFVKKIAKIYAELGLLSENEANNAQELRDVEAVSKVIAKVPQMSREQRLQFCDVFVRDGFDGATPAILADAYRSVFGRAKTDDAQKQRLKDLAKHIDNLSEDFANTGGMVINTGSNALVDVSNIADVYEGFEDMLRARMGDVDKLDDQNAVDARLQEMADLGVSLEQAKIDQMNSNIGHLETVISEYDENWGISNLGPDNAASLEENWDNLNEALGRAELTDETKAMLSKYKFLDKNGKVIPQFRSANNRDKTEYEEWEQGRKIIKGGRLATIIDLTRHDLAKRHVLDENIDEDSLEQELNEEVLFKLYEMDTADKIINGAMEDPEAFMKPENRDAFIAELSQQGGEMSDAGYNAALDAQVNATAGWAARIKKKVGNAGTRIGGFFGKVFRPLQRVDRLNGARMTRGPVSKRQKRIEFFTRVFKGFLSAFVASTLITLIATAAAATAGISFAASMAAVGIATAIGMGVVQVMRWRKAQEAAGLPTDIRAFLADKRLVLSLGVSVLAVAAMCFGAAGLAQTAMALGYGALAIGGTKNAVEMYRDARDANLSVAESVAWAIANAGAIIGGGFAGRAAARGIIDAHNHNNPENTRYQEEGSKQVPREVDDVRDVTGVRSELTPDAAEYAKNTVEMWYQDDPALLQQRIDAINAYNADHGTNLNPYRVLLVNGEAGGLTADNMRLHVDYSHLDPNIDDVYSHANHRVMTDAWGRARGFDPSDLRAAADTFTGGADAFEAGMQQILNLDQYVYSHGQIDYVHGVPSSADHVQTDGYFRPNDPRGWTTYTEGESSYHDVEYTYQEPYTRTVYDTVPKYTPVHGSGMAMFGTYDPRERLTKLRDRVGAFADRIFGRKKDKGPQDDTPPHKQDDGPVLPPVKDDDSRLLPPGRDNNGRLLPPGREDDGRLLPPGKEDDGRLLPPGREDDDGRLLPSGKDKDGRLLPPGRDEWQPAPKKKHIALDDRYWRDEDVLVLWVDRSQAKAWKDLHDQLKDVEEKLAHSHGSEAAKLKAKKSSLQYDIAKIRNKLGHANDVEINLGSELAFKREELKQCSEAIDKLLAHKPDSNRGASKQDIAAWQAKIQKLQERFQELNRELDEYDYYWPVPEQGVQAKKQQEREERAAQKAEIVEEVEPEEVEIEIEPEENSDNKASLEQIKKKVEDWLKAHGGNVSDRPFEFEHTVPEYDNSYKRDETMDLSKYTVPYVNVGDMLKGEQEEITPTELAQEHEAEPFVNPDKAVDVGVVLPDEKGVTMAEESRQESKEIPIVTDALSEVKHMNQGKTETKGRFGFVAALEKAAGKMLERISGRKYKIPVALTKLANDSTKLSEKIGALRNGKLAVKLVDLNINGNPVVQNSNIPLVVVDIDGLKIAYQLVTGLENHDLETDFVPNPGRWYPVARMSDNGDIALSMDLCTPELMSVGKMLDTTIGDIRNYEDEDLTTILLSNGGHGFVGGCDVMPDADMPSMCHMLHTGGEWQDVDERWHDIYSGSLSDGIKTVSVLHEEVLGALDGKEEIAIKAERESLRGRLFGRRRREQ